MSMRVNHRLWGIDLCLLVTMVKQSLFVQGQSTFSQPIICCCNNQRCLQNRWQKKIPTFPFLGKKNPPRIIVYAVLFYSCISNWHRSLSHAVTRNWTYLFLIFSAAIANLADRIEAFVCSYLPRNRLLLIVCQLNHSLFQKFPSWLLICKTAQDVSKGVFNRFHSTDRSAEARRDSLARCPIAILPRANCRQWTTGFTSCFPVWLPRSNWLVTVWHSRLD